MDVATAFLRGDQPRARWKRLDPAQILKRFFFCERSVIVNASCWIPHLSPLDVKVGIQLLFWQSPETANALRQRVFELRYPSGLMEKEGPEKPMGAGFWRLGVCTFE